MISARLFPCFVSFLTMLFLYVQCITKVSAYQDWYALTQYSQLESKID